MMRRVVCAIVLVCVLGSGRAAAQSADAYFHEAAQQYIDNNLPAARRAVTQGLEVAPKDARLQALQEKLRETRRSTGTADRSSRSGQRQQQSGQQSEQSSEGGQSRSESGQRSRAEPGAQQQNRSGGQGQSRPQNGEERRAGEEGPERQPRAGGGQRAREGEPRPVRALSRAQAEQLLRALEVQERQLLRTLAPREGDASTVEKDW